MVAILFRGAGARELLPEAHAKPLNRGAGVENGKLADLGYAAGGYCKC
jgi:hypothetical protein